MRRSRFLALFATAVATVSCSAGPQAAMPEPEPVVVYLVRHAEKVDASADPALSAEGTERAQLLAHILADAGITQIHSTDYERTRQTGAPLAEQLGMDIASYDPRDLPGFAARLRATPGRHLVLGHSNTTPDLVAALGGDPMGAIDEAAEYDRLYSVVILGDKTVSTLLRYGVPFVGADAEG